MADPIDFHTHFIPPAFVEALARDGRRLGAWLEEDAAGGRRVVFADDFRTAYPLFSGLVDLPHRLTMQAEMGIGIQVLAGWMDMVGYSLAPRQGQELSRLANETMAELVDARPDRLRGVATVPLQDPARAAEEVHHASRRLGFRAVQIGTHVNGRNLDEPALDPFWGACQARAMLVLIHPHRVAAPERLADYFASNALGNPFETTLAAASLLLGGVLERFPALTVCLAHAGGFLPYQLGRLDHAFAVKEEARRRASVPPSAHLGRLYFDTISHSGPALGYLLDLVGPERLLFGTDLPFPMADRQMLARLDRLPGLTPDARAMVVHGNAARLLGLPVPAESAADRTPAP